jgi:soluble lytic murein transglycosylase-like protein
MPKLPSFFLPLLKYFSIFLGIYFALYIEVLYIYHQKISLVYALQNASNYSCKALQSPCFKTLQDQKHQEILQIAKKKKERELLLAQRKRQTTKPNSDSVTSTAPNAGGISDLISKYASQYNVNPAILSKIAQCESGFNPGATNGPYGGMFQFHPQTWISNRKSMGEDPSTSLRFNTEEAIKTAAYKISRDGTGAWPICGKG